MVVLKEDGTFLGALVVAPLRPAYMVWPAEQAKWSDFEDLSVAVLHGKNKEALAAQRHDVYVINYEGLDWLINSGTLAMLLKKKWIDTLVLDELSKMSNASKKAKRRKLLVPWLPKFARRWGLTGSPASNGLIKLFGQINVLDLGAAFGPYITYFRNKFFTPVGMYSWALKEGAEKLIYKTIANVALRFELPKSAGVPSLVENNIIVDLPPAARRAYDEIEQQMLTILDDSTVTAGTAGAVYGKCCQIAAGAVFLSPIDPITGETKAGKREWKNIHDEKLDALEELIEELQGQQLLTAYWYEHDLQKIQARFGKAIAYIGSGVSMKRALEYEAAWNAGELQYLFGHPMSMGHGLNLQGSGAHHIAWYTTPPDYELYDQFNRRLRRRGNAAKVVTAHRIVARQTVDTWNTLPSLKRKGGTQQRLFDALRVNSKSRRGGA